MKKPKRKQKNNNKFAHSALKIIISKMNDLKVVQIRNENSKTRLLSGKNKMKLIGKTKLILATFAFLALVLSLSECMKRTQYHEQVSSNLLEDI